MFQSRLPLCSPAPTPHPSQFHETGRGFLCFGDELGADGVEAGGRQLLWAWVISPPSFLLQQNSSGWDCFSNERRKERQPASVSRAATCHPLKSFKVEAFGVTRKLFAHLTSGGIWEGRKLFTGRAGPPRPPAGRGSGPCFCGAARAVLHTLFTELQVSFQMSSLLI